MKIVMALAAVIPVYLLHAGHRQAVGHPSAPVLLSRTERTFHSFETGRQVQTTVFGYRCCTLHFTSRARRVWTFRNGFQHRDRLWYSRGNRGFGIGFVQVRNQRVAWRIGGRWICSAQVAGRLVYQRFDKLLGKRRHSDVGFFGYTPVTTRLSYVGVARFRRVAVWHIRERLSLNLGSGNSRAETGSGSESGKTMTFVTDYWVSQRDYTLRRETKQETMMKHGIVTFRSMTWSRYSHYGWPVNIQLPRKCSGMEPGKGHNR